MEFRNGDRGFSIYFGERVANHLVGPRLAAKSFDVWLRVLRDDDGELALRVARYIPNMCSGPVPEHYGRRIRAQRYETTAGVVRYSVSVANMQRLGLESVHDTNRMAIDVYLMAGFGNVENQAWVTLPESVREVGTQVPDREQEIPEIGNLVRHVRETSDQHGLEAVTRAVLHELNAAANARGKTLNADAGVVRLLDLPRGVTFEG